MMRFFTTLVAICVVLAQVPAYAQDTKAKEILEQASKKMSSLKTLKAAFTLNLLGKSGQVIESQKGSVMMKGQQYHVLMPKQEIICDGKTVWTLLKDAKEVQVSAYNPDEQTVSPTKLFTNFYDKEYNYTYVGLKKVNGKMCDIIEMKPKDAGKQFTKVALAFDKSHTITGGSVTEKSGNQYAYEIGLVTPNPPLSANQFSYNAALHPGIEVVDLR